LEDRLVLSTYIVNSTGDTGTGTALTGDLRYCITQANAAGGGNKITFSPTVFANPQTTIILNSPLPTITDSGINIAGSNAGKITIDGNSQFPVLVISAKNATVGFVTISNGKAALDGGGIDYSGDGKLTLTHAVISGDTASIRGGGVYASNPNGTVSALNTYFYDNTAYYSGGLATNGTTTLTNSIFTGNSAKAGGGIGNNGTLTINNSFFIQNTATYFGGIVNNGTATITSSSFFDNFADVGGAVGNHGIATIGSSYFSGNYADAVGGIVNSGSLTLTGSTFVFNEDYDDAGAIYNLATGTASISNSTITGNASLYGTGAIRNLGSMTVANSSISGNRGFYGDGVGGFSNYGQLTFTNTSITNNTGLVGAGINFGTLSLTGSTVSSNKGAIYGYFGTYGLTGGIYNQGTATLTNSTVSGNTVPSGAGYGGGLDNVFGGLTVTNSTISGNTAAVGGGIYNLGNLTMQGSTVSGNNSQYGGGILNNSFTSAYNGYTYYGSETLVNCTLSGNSATNQGGAVYDAGVSEITNSTISGNTAGTLGGGIYVPVTPFSETLANSIVAGNTAATYNDIGGAVNTTSGFNLIGDGTGLVGISDGSDGNMIGTLGSPIDPQLGALGNNGGLTETMALLSGSPAIDAGSNLLAVDGLGNALATDQIGNARIFNGTVDIGAVEFQGGPSLTVRTSSSSAVFGQSVTLTAQIARAHTTDPEPGGTVQFTVNGKDFGAPVPVENGVATLDTSSLPLGNSTIKAIYSGDGHYHAASSAKITESVSKDNSVLELTGAVNSSTVTFTAKVGAASPGSGVPTGNVTFKDGSTVLATVPLVNGVATYSASNLSSGNHDIYAKYDGGADFTASGSSSVTVAVTSHAGATKISLGVVHSPSFIGAVPLSPAMEALYSGEHTYPLKTKQSGSHPAPALEKSPQLLRQTHGSAVGAAVLRAPGAHGAALLHGQVSNFAVVQQGSSPQLHVATVNQIFAAPKHTTAQSDGSMTTAHPAAKSVNELLSFLFG
jgi:hypothetical protein